jgi:hypothetical protein
MFPDCRALSQVADSCPELKVVSKEFMCINVMCDIVVSYLLALLTYFHTLSPLVTFTN